MASQASAMIPRLKTLRRPGLTTPLAVVLVGIVAFWLIENLIKSPSDVYANFIYGATNGLLYGLIAIGYTLVYGILELINFAHGDVFMLGSMMSATLAGGIFGLASGQRGILVWVTVLGVGVVAMAFCGALNTTIEFVAYRPLRGAP